MKDNKFSRVIKADSEFVNAAAHAQAAPTSVQIGFNTMRSFRNVFRELYKSKGFTSLVGIYRQDLINLHQKYDPYTLKNEFNSIIELLPSQIFNSSSFVVTCLLVPASQVDDFQQSKELIVSVECAATKVYQLHTLAILMILRNQTPDTFNELIEIINKNNKMK